MSVLGFLDSIFIISTQSLLHFAISLLLLVPETILEASKTVFAPVLQFCIELQPQWGSSNRVN